MINNSNTVLLLTACIRPAGMLYTCLQDAEIREEQYKEALSFYLEQTDYKVVFVENTNADISYLFQSYIDAGRLEYLFFEGNNFDKTLGKGYGEALILKYAMEHSVFIKNAFFVIKITGRLKIENINELCQKVHLSEIRGAILACNVRPSKKAGISYFFIFRKDFCYDYFLPYINEINDSKNRFFEHVLFESVLRCKREGYRCQIFPLPIKVKGISGTKGKAYKAVTWKDYILSWGASFLYNQLRYEKF